jgi:uncharacterized protein YlxW (UPF0749 family)
MEHTLTKFDFIAGAEWADSTRAVSTLDNFEVLKKFDEYKLKEVDFLRENVRLAKEIAAEREKVAKLRASLGEAKTALSDADCDCSVQDILSGHRSHCHMPYANESLTKVIKVLSETETQEDERG